MGDHEQTGAHIAEQAEANLAMSTETLEMARGYYEHGHGERLRGEAQLEAARAYFEQATATFCEARDMLVKANRRTWLAAGALVLTIGVIAVHLIRLP